MPEGLLSAPSQATEGFPLHAGCTFMFIIIAGVREVHDIATLDGAKRDIAVLAAAFEAVQMIGPVFASALYIAMTSFDPPP